MIIPFDGNLSCSFKIFAVAKKHSNNTNSVLNLLAQAMLVGMIRNIKKEIIQISLTKQHEKVLIPMLTLGEFKAIYSMSSYICTSCRLYDNGNGIMTFSKTKTN